jgi:hypothetical protein
MHEPSIDDLPRDPREALLGLIGSTFSELKRIDSALITKSNNVVGIKTDLNRLVAEANSLNNQVATPPPVLPPPQVNNAQPSILEPKPVEVQLQPVPVVEPQQQKEDDGQLLLDFYRKITPEDINSRLADIDIKLNKIIMLLNGLEDKR